MTRLRIASAVAIMAFLAVPVGMTAWSQDKAGSQGRRAATRASSTSSSTCSAMCWNASARDYVEPVDEKT